MLRSKDELNKMMSKKPGKLLMKLFLQKQKSKIGAETYNTDLTNQNHCEELNTL